MALVRTPRIATTGSSRPLAGRTGEGEDHVTCRLCHRPFRMLTKSHLVKAHEFQSRNPLREYKEKYGLTRVRSLNTIRAQRRSLIACYVQQGRRWTKARIVTEVRKFLRSGAPFSSSELALRFGSLRKVTARSFGSWNRLVRACGLDPARVKRPRRWTKAAILRTIRALKHNRLNRKSATKVDSGLVNAAASKFGTWDSALRAAGRDPARVRKIRHWDPDLVLKEIRRSVRGRYRQEVLRTCPALVAIAAFYFGNWPTAMDFAGASARAHPACPNWSPGRLLAEMRRRGGCPEAR